MHPNILSFQQTPLTMRAGFSGCQFIGIELHPAWLVVLTILTNMKVNGKDYPIYYGQ